MVFPELPVPGWAKQGVCIYPQLQGLGKHKDCPVCLIPPLFSPPNSSGGVRTLLPRVSDLPHCPGVLLLPNSCSESGCAKAAVNRDGTGSVSKEHFGREFCASASPGRANKARKMLHSSWVWHEREGICQEGGKHPHSVPG